MTMRGGRLNVPIVGEELRSGRLPCKLQSAGEIPAPVRQASHPPITGSRPDRRIGVRPSEARSPPAATSGRRCFLRVDLSGLSRTSVQPGQMWRESFQDSGPADGPSSSWPGWHEPPAGPAAGPAKIGGRDAACSQIRSGRFRRRKPGAGSPGGVDRTEPRRRHRSHSHDYYLHSSLKRSSSIYHLIEHYFATHHRGEWAAAGG
jgi:hypothetical protein